MSTLRAALTFIGGAALISCGNDTTAPPPPPPASTIVVTTRTSGADLADGYTLTVSNGQYRHEMPIGNNESLKVSLAPGQYSLTLGDIRFNCQLAGANSRTASLATGQTVRPAQFELTCTKRPVASIATTGDASTIGVGETVELSATPLDQEGSSLDRPIAWGTSDPGLAAVTDEGIARGVARGAVTITATSEDKTASLAIIVGAPAASIVVLPISVTLNGQCGTQLTAELRDAQGQLLSGRRPTWSSDNSRSVEVYGDGAVTAINKGTAIVTASTGLQSGRATVKVARPPGMCD